MSLFQVLLIFKKIISLDFDNPESELRYLFSSLSYFSKKLELVVKTSREKRCEVFSEAILPLVLGGQVPNCLCILERKNEHRRFDVLIEKLGLLDEKIKHFDPRNWGVGVFDEKKGTLDFSNVPGQKKVALAETVTGASGVIRRRIILSASAYQDYKKASLV